MPLNVFLSILRKVGVSQRKEYFCINLPFPGLTPFLAKNFETPPSDPIFGRTYPPPLLLIRAGVPTMIYIKKSKSNCFFLSLQSNFSNLRTSLNTLLLYLFQMIHEIDSVLLKQIFARNRNTNVATSINIFFSDEQCRYHKQIYELTNSYIFLTTTCF